MQVPPTYSTLLNVHSEYAQVVPRDGYFVQYSPSDFVLILA